MEPCSCVSDMITPLYHDIIDLDSTLGHGSRMLSFNGQGCTLPAPGYSPGDLPFSS